MTGSIAAAIGSASRAEPARRRQHVLEVDEVRHQRMQITLDSYESELGEREEVVIAGRRHRLPEPVPRLGAAAERETPRRHHEGAALHALDATLVYADQVLRLTDPHQESRPEKAPPAQQH